MSDFDFVSDTTLRSNIEEVNDLIFELLIRSVSTDYQDKPRLVSSLRKTIIIHTATIVEAVLLWKLKQFHSSNEISLDDEWDYKDIHHIHDLSNSSEQIVWCKRKLVKKRLDRLDFLHITRLCEKHAILRGDRLIADVNRIRELRNKLHIGGLTEIDQEYKSKDLEFCFSVLKRTKRLIEKTRNPRS
jgi:hypothetical protein